ncbi:FAD-dependent tricarballylate dehydrogenase TcuA [Sphingomonas sp. SUN039]|uniref:FAD-dependent tricarballylate dehydrogenase TcuA n=1 Tax=Sphingomonas sp. SUN039 TaxID=2937787 RepID=UPI0021641FF4|nr:FAD-dependent tricarballylate dehydrogenase TcuA [Sphingomonas sp. SUN039]UVO54575.1 FAD-dependent tricarballylate dehydrogenase TcuA [Sphingomonas sp. SUN039]
MPDVLVIGGGNAALCAAISARAAGASVMILESAPRHMRAGNSRHTRNIRVMHTTPQAPLLGQYEASEYFDDLLKVTGGRTDTGLATLVIEQSTEAFQFLRSHGVHFQRALSGTLNLSRTNAFFLGGGKALVNALYATAERMGIAIRYDAEVQSVVLRDQRIGFVEFQSEGEHKSLIPKAVVAASGGFQANLEWLGEAWGDAAANFAVRGTPYAQGKVLRNLIEQGVATVGDPTQCHAVAVDARAPQFDGGIVTRLDAIPFGIVVNVRAERFHDEGEDIWPKRYAIWGRLIAEQPGQCAWVICDKPATALFMPSCYPAIEADTLEGLAERLGLDAPALAKIVGSFNAACPKSGFDAAGLDGCATVGLSPPKSNWAAPIATPPFIAYPLRPGITFTYLGVKVDRHARVQDATDQPVDNLYAAGEIMAGSILGQGYLAGFGMAIGSVFGRIAGQEAARHART